MLVHIPTKSACLIDFSIDGKKASKLDFSTSHMMDENRSLKGHISLALNVNIS